MDEWLITYDLYTDVELAAEITFLKTQLTNPFLAQVEGNRSYTRSTAEFRTRLAAASQITKARSTTETRHGQADFSLVQP